MKFHDEMFEAFKSCRDSDVLCDVTIQVEDQSFQVHKLMLAAASPYFKAMFTIEMKEKYQQQIAIKDVTSNGFRACLDFVYSAGKINMTTYDIEKVLQASCLFQMRALKDICVEAIKSTLDAENCLEMWMLARKFDLVESQNSAKKLVLKNAETVIKNKEAFANINPELFEEMLISDELVIPKEDVLFETLLEWVEVDKEERNQYFCRFYQLIKLPMVSKEYFRGTITKNSHVSRDCSQCTKYSHQAVNLFLGRDINNFTQHQLKKRNCELDDILVVSHNGKIFQNIRFYNYKSSNVPVKRNPIGTDVRQITLHSNKIYVMGGINHKKVFVCDFQNNKKWQELQSMPNVHGYGSIINFGKQILVAGGRRGNNNNNNCTRKVDLFNVETNTWSQFPHLGIARSSMASVSHGNDILVIGGIDSSSSFSKVVGWFDSASNRWKRMANLNQARSSASAEFYKDKIYVIGGVNGSDYLAYVETYVIGNRCWNVVSAINVQRQLPGAAVVDDKLIVFGGKRDHNTSLYETFELENNKWKQSQVKNDKIKECSIFYKCI